MVVADGLYKGKSIATKSSGIGRDSVSPVLARSRRSQATCDIEVDGQKKSFLVEKRSEASTAVSSLFLSLFSRVEMLLSQVLD